MKYSWKVDNCQAFLGSGLFASECSLKKVRFFFSLSCVFTCTNIYRWNDKVQTTIHSAKKCIDYNDIEQGKLAFRWYNLRCRPENSTSMVHQYSDTRGIASADQRSIGKNRSKYCGMLLLPFFFLLLIHRLANRVSRVLSLPSFLLFICIPTGLVACE